MSEGKRFVEPGDQGETRLVCSTNEIRESNGVSHPLNICSWICGVSTTTFVHLQHGQGVPCADPEKG